MQNGKLSEMHKILATADPDEDTGARQAVVREFLGDYLLNPSWPTAPLSLLRRARLIALRVGFAPSHKVPLTDFPSPLSIR